MKSISLILPNNWNDISNWQAKELAILTDNIDEYEELDYIFELISIVTNLNVEDERIQTLKKSELYEINKKLRFISNDFVYNNDLSEIYIEVNGIKYKRIAAIDMSVSQYINADSFITNPMLNCSELMANFYRRYYLDEFGNEILEKDSFDFEQRTKEFEDYSFGMGTIAFFMNFKKECFANYKLVDETIEENEENGEKEHLTYRERIKKEDEEEQEQLNRIFNWDILLMNLSGNDIQKSWELLDLPITYLFRIITLKKMKLTD